MSRRKPGPQPKGERSAFTIRVPIDYRPILDAAAAEAGMSLGDYAATVLARSLDLPDPAYIHAKDQKDQEALPLGA